MFNDGIVFLWNTQLSLLVSCSMKQNPSKRIKTNAVKLQNPVLYTGEFPRKQQENGRIGIVVGSSRLPKVKEDLTFCSDINGTALTPRGLSVVQTEGVEGNVDIKERAPCSRGLVPFKDAGC